MISRSPESTGSPYACGSLGESKDRLWSSGESQRTKLWDGQRYRLLGSVYPCSFACAVMISIAADLAFALLP